MALDVLRRIGERLDGVSGCVGGGFLCRLCVEEIFYRAANAVEPLQCGRVKLFECCGGGFDKNRAVENPGVSMWRLTFVLRAERPLNAAFRGRPS